MQKQTAAALEQKIEEMRRAGDLGGEIEWRGRKAALLLSELAWAAAATELDEMAALVAADGQTHNEAQARFAQGRALANLATRQDDAAAAFETALRLYRQTEDQAHEMEVIQHLAALRMRTGEYDTAVTLINAGLAQTEDPAQRVGLYRVRAGLNVWALKFEAALADMEQALALLPAVRDEALAAATRSQYDGVQGLARGRVTAVDPWLQNDQLAADGLLDDHLQKALRAVQKKKWRAALRQAERARTAARDAADMQRFIRYLLASLTIADVQDALGNRVETLTALLRCKVYLEHNLGPAIGRYVDQVLDSLSVRWGQEGLQTAVRAYRQKVAEEGPIQI